MSLRPRDAAEVKKNGSHSLQALRIPLTMSGGKIFWSYVTATLTAPRGAGQGLCKGLMLKFVMGKCFFHDPCIMNEYMFVRRGFRESYIKNPLINTHHSNGCAFHEGASEFRWGCLLVVF